MSPNLNVIKWYNLTDHNPFHRPFCQSASWALRQHLFHEEYAGTGQDNMKQVAESK